MGPPTKDTSYLLAGSRIEQVVEGQEEERRIECEEQDDEGDVHAPGADKHEEGENEPGKHWISQERQ